LLCTRPMLEYAYVHPWVYAVSFVAGSAAMRALGSETAGAALQDMVAC
jgi:hypothetical protein